MDNRASRGPLLLKSSQMPPKCCHVLDPLCPSTPPLSIATSPPSTHPHAHFQFRRHVGTHHDSRPLRGDRVLHRIWQRRRHLLGGEGLQRRGQDRNSCSRASHQYSAGYHQLLDYRKQSSFKLRPSANERGRNEDCLGDILAPRHPLDNNNVCAPIFPGLPAASASDNAITAPTPLPSSYFPTSTPLSAPTNSTAPREQSASLAQTRPLTSRPTPSPSGASTNQHGTYPATLIRTTLSGGATVTACETKPATPRRSQSWN